jgi:ATP-dependent Lon protease
LKKHKNLFIGLSSQRKEEIKNNVWSNVMQMVSFLLKKTEFIHPDRIPLQKALEKIDLLKNKMFSYSTKNPILHEKKIHDKNKIGLINGLWANSMGKGGIIPIETMFFPSSTFLELRLTGLQGDVMKESMNVAKTLAWNLTDLEKKKELIQFFEESRSQGLHIHCPEGAISKDGPSAGVAITLVIYSLLNNKKIKNDIAITGEINLQGDITAIGGLEYKIIGGINAGIKTFLYPKLNHNHFQDFLEKYENKIPLNNIKFIEVSNILETFSYVFSE